MSGLCVDVSLFTSKDNTTKSLKINFYSQFSPFKKVLSRPQTALAISFAPYSFHLDALQKSKTKKKDSNPTCAGDLRACGFKVMGLVGVNSIPGTRSNMRSYGNKRNQKTNFKPEASLNLLHLLFLFFIQGYCRPLTRKLVQS